MGKRVSFYPLFPTAMAIRLSKTAMESIKSRRPGQQKTEKAPMPNPKDCWSGTRFVDR